MYRGGILRIMIEDHYVTGSFLNHASIQLKQAFVEIGYDGEVRRFYLLVKLLNCLVVHFAI